MLKLRNDIYDPIISERGLLIQKIGQDNDQTQLQRAE